IMAPMNLSPYIENVQQQLAAAVAAGNDEARALADQLAPALESAVRLALQDALAAAVHEITLELAPGSVELRLRGREPEFVVSLPPPEPGADAEEDVLVAPNTPQATASGPDDGSEGDDTTMSRINLRLPDRLKSRVEDAAAAQGLSVNAWLVRTAAGAVDAGGPLRRREARAPQGKQRYSGWVR